MLLFRKHLLVLAVAALVHAASASDYLVYFGTFTNALSRGIYVSRLDSVTGNLSAPELAAESPSPCFLAVSPSEKYLYAANNNIIQNGQTTGAVTAFAIDHKSGQLVELNQKPTGGSADCYVCADFSAKVVLAANYAAGSVKSFQLNDDGTIGSDGSYIKHHGSSVNTNRQTSPHAHFIHTDPSHRFALVCDLGTDKVVVYKIDHSSGTLTENSVATVPPGSGARHLVFSPDAKFVHVANEMGCTITTFAWDAHAGTLSEVETVSVLPPGVTPKSTYTAAEIVERGKFVYATIRGHDSVSVFTADSKSGRLQFLQNVSSNGSFPRGLGIDPTGHWLFTGNQKANSVTEFAIDAQTGKISATGRELKIGSPVDVQFVKASE